MKKAVGVLIFAAGALTGAFVANHILKTKYEALVDEEIQSVREAFEEHLNDLIDKGYVAKTTVQTTHVNDVAKELEPDDAPTPASRVVPMRNPYERAKTAYDLVGKANGGELPHITPEPYVEDGEDPYSEEEDDDEDTSEYEVDESDSERDLGDIDRTKPYLINSDEFTDEFDHHDKLSLYYYRVDGVLTDETSAISSIVDEAVGPEALLELETERTVWVRNEPLGIDYEIIAIDGLYSESVHRIGMTPREEYDKKRREQGEEV